MRTSLKDCLSAISDLPLQCAIVKDSLVSGHALNCEEIWPYMLRKDSAETLYWSPESPIRCWDSLADLVGKIP